LKSIRACGIYVEFVSGICDIPSIDFGFEKIFLKQLFSSSLLVLAFAAPPATRSLRLQLLRCGCNCMALAKDGGAS
jgi:hypothetical protein